MYNPDKNICTPEHIEENIELQIPPPIVLGLISCKSRIVLQMSTVVVILKKKDTLNNLSKKFIGFHRFNGLFSPKNRLLFLS